MLQIEVIGNLGSDAEIKDFGGKKYVSMNIAHSERHKGENGPTETTVWVSCLWYGDGGSLFQYLKKGCKVFLRGRLVPKAYTDKQGKPQCAVNMYANEVTLCGGKAEAQTQNQTNAAQQATKEDNDLPF